MGIADEELAKYQRLLSEARAAKQIMLSAAHVHAESLLHLQKSQRDIALSRTEAELDQRETVAAIADSHERDYFRNWLAARETWQNLSQQADAETVRRMELG